MVAPKGSQVNFNSPHLVFTSNVDPRDWYTKYILNNGKKAHKDALERRIQDFAEIIDCTTEEVLVPHNEGPVKVRRRAKRTAEFKFRENLGVDFSTDSSQHFGDSGQGAGYMNSATNDQRAYEY